MVAECPALAFFDDGQVAVFQLGQLAHHPAAQ
jgi:hypothetical protein